jgi:hypothetical protein
MQRKVDTKDKTSKMQIVPRYLSNTAYKFDTSRIQVTLAFLTNTNVLKLSGTGEGRGQ